MRIASLAPSNTEIVFALGAGKDLVCTTKYCDYPPEANSIAKVGGWLNTDFEKLKELKPDVVLTSNFLQDKLVGLLRSKGFNVVHVDPRTFEQVLDSFIVVGEAINRVGQARKLVAGIHSEVGKIQEKTKDVVKRKHVYVEEWGDPPTVSGNWVPDLVRIAGGKSIIEQGFVSRKVSLEEIKEFNPDLMIVSWCGFSEKVGLELIHGRPGWKDLIVVKEGKIVVFNDSLLNRPGPRLVDGLKKLQSLTLP